MNPEPAGAIELIRPPSGRRPQLALFDFDGTLSLIREGWPDVMIPMMVEILARLNTGLAAEQLRKTVAEDVAQSTGQVTLIQMIRLAERVAEFGGTPLDPRQYKAEYDRRLRAHIAGRRSGLASGAIAPDAMLLTGAQPMLEALASRGVAMALASGTDDPDVREEAEVLGVARYFGPRIYGAKDDYEASGKKRVVERLLAESGIAGRDMLVFGDGFVEIECVKAVGGYAVGVASDEAAGGGRINAWKRERLLRAGADMIVPDFAEHARLAHLLLGP